MEIKGKVVSILEVQTGEGKKGTWRKGGFVIETEGQYPKNIAIDLFNDILDKCPKVGDVVTSHLNIESREFNGKWYTNISAWKLEGNSANTQSTQGAPAPITGGAEPDDLPF